MNNMYRFDISISLIYINWKFQQIFQIQIGTFRNLSLRPNRQPEVFPAKYKKFREISCIKFN